MKKFLTTLISMILIVTILCATMPSVVTANAAEPKILLLQVGNTSALLNGEVIPVLSSTGFPITPKAVNGKIFLPTRFISETLGATVKYNGVSEPITIQNGDTFISVKLGDNFLTVRENGKDRKIDLPVPAHTISNSIYLPFREIGEALGYEVTYSASDKGSFVALSNEKMTAHEAASLGSKNLIPLRPTENQMEVIFWANSITGNQAVLINHNMNAHPAQDPTILNAPPLQFGGKAYIPANLLERMGARFEWNDKKQTGTFTYQRPEGRDVLSVTVGKKTMIKNKVELELNLAPRIEDGKLYVPMKAVSEGLDFNFYWDDTMSTGVISENCLDYAEQGDSMLKLTQCGFFCFKPNVPSGKTAWDADKIKSIMIYSCERVGMIYDDTITLQSTWNPPHDTQFYTVEYLYDHVALEYGAVATAVSNKGSFEKKNYFNIIVVPTQELYNWGKTTDLAFVVALSGMTQ